MKKFYLMLGLWAALFSVCAQNVATFESVQLDSASWWNGSDGSGGFSSGGFRFPNDYNQEWGSWSGFSVSNMKDSTTAGWSNQYSAITAGGVNNSENYAVVYTSGELKMEFDNPVSLSGLYVTNSTYAYLTMKNGDAYSKKFGGEDGTDPDYFKLIVSGTGIYGEETAEIEFFLADFTSENDEDDYILSTWKWVDLGSLGVVKNIKFRLESSDVGDWGMNTPAYFCMDNFNGRSPDAVEILTEAGMEDLNLQEDSFYNGSDGAGSFKSGGFTFQNSYNAEWGSWTGFAASSKTDTTTAGWSNQYSAIAGLGALETESYAVAYPLGFSEIEFSETTVSGFYITNSTYTYLSMLDGDDYAKKFGGQDGNDPDWFKVTIASISSSGDTIETVDYYLADFRFDENEKDYIINDWQWVDLSSFGKISKLRFSLSSSDMGAWGMNTPGYFCIDQLNHQDLPPEIVNPVATIGEETNPERVFYVDMDSVFSDPDNPDSQIELALEFIENTNLLTGTVVKGGNPNFPEKTMLSLNVTPEMTGESEVIISATSNGKKAYHSFSVVVQYPVAAEFMAQEKLNVYPNPFKNHLNIDLPHSAKSIMLTNQSGQVILKQRLHNESNIKLTALDSYQAGVYILIIKTAGDNISRKILKF
ncbi:MAG TPA: DUF4465 domain-containing protein [Tangfeifania sp.]|nr:DUF4465 domain-containing protein [Tangfeifania sp.]